MSLELAPIAPLSRDAGPEVIQAVVLVARDSAKARPYEPSTRYAAGRVRRRSTVSGGEKRLMADRRLSPDRPRQHQDVRRDRRAGG
jgi:hypothetical protein